MHIIPFIVFLQQLQNLSLIKRAHYTNPNGGIFFKTTDPNSPENIKDKELFQLLTTYSQMVQNQYTYEKLNKQMVNLNKLHKALPFLIYFFSLKLLSK